MALKTLISKIGFRDGVEHFKIVTPVEVRREDELDSPELALIINGDQHTFEKVISFEFPNTWFLKVFRKTKSNRK